MSFAVGFKNILSLFKSFSSSIYLLYYTGTWVHSVCVEVRGLLYGVASLLPPCGLWSLNSGPLYLPSHLTGPVYYFWYLKPRCPLSTSFRRGPLLSFCPSKGLLSGKQKFLDLVHFPVLNHEPHPDLSLMISLAVAIWCQGEVGLHVRRHDSAGEDGLYKIWRVLIFLWDVL